MVRAGSKNPAGAGAPPYGKPASDNEPAVHITYDEAHAYCRWAGKRLPTDAEWTQAAYQEISDMTPSPPFVKGQTYPYPTGTSPAGANCLNDCGPTRQRWIIQKSSTKGAATPRREQPNPA